jgi:hypothetical protein
MNFYCKFCPRILNSDKQLIIQSRFTNTEIFHCSGCQVTYAVEIKTNKIIAYSLDHPDFFIEFIPNNSFCIISIKNDETLLELDHCPENITPQNLNEKLKTILTFL